MTTGFNSEVIAETTSYWDEFRSKVKVTGVGVVGLTVEDCFEEGNQNNRTN